MSAAMADRPSPMIFPSRKTLNFDPAVPDRQLWAIGMITVQWAMVELTMNQNIHQLVGDDLELIEELSKVRNFKQRADFWQVQIELKMVDPQRANALRCLSLVRQLKSQRDEVMHRPWGGGMQAGSWSAENHPTIDSGLMLKTGETPQVNKKGEANLFTWNMTFGRLRQMAQEISDLNVRMIKTFMWGE